MIQFDRVSKKYDNGHQALSQISYEIPAGEVTFLTGHSGAGKSTLLKLIMRLEKPSQGIVTVNKTNVGQLKKRQIPYYRQQIGMVHQNHQLLFDRSVYDNVALPMLVSGYKSEDIGRRVRAALDKVGLLAKEKLNPITLSGGEQQRVGIARAVVNKPVVLLADEPTGNLDPKLSAEIMDLFIQFSQVGVAVLIATHDLSLIARYKHRLLVLEKGRLVESAQQ